MVNVLDYNLDTIKLRVGIATNKSLLDEFANTFYAIGTYQPKNKFEETHLLELSKIFIDEFTKRLKKYQRRNDRNAVEEFAQIMKEMLKSNKFELPKNAQEDSGFVYMVNNTLRLYSFCIKTMKKMGIDFYYLKKEYL